MITGLSPQRDPMRDNVIVRSPRGRACSRREFGPREPPLRIFRDSREHKASGWRVPRPYVVITAACLCAAALVAPAIAQARDLVVYGEPTLEKALKSVGILWQARTGTRVNVFVAPSDLYYTQIDRGARCDVIFAQAGS